VNAEVLLEEEDGLLSWRRIES